MQAYRYDRLDSEFSRDYRVALSTANCAVGFGNETQFARYLEAPNKQFNNFYSLIDNNYSTCISRTGSTDRALYTAAFAETLVVKGDAAYAPRAMTLNVDDADAFIAMDDKSVGALDKVTRCLVVYSPGLAYDVFKTEVGSEAEKAQLDALYAGTPECGNARRPEAIMAGLQRASLAYAFYGWTNRTS